MTEKKYHTSHSNHAPRLAVIADIHGVLPTLETVLAEILIDPPGEIIVAGGYCRRPPTARNAGLAAGT